MGECGGDFVWGLQIPNHLLSDCKSERAAIFLFTIISLILIKINNMLSEIANNYKTMVQFLPDLIDVSGYRNDYLSKKMELSPATFSAKKTRGNWSADEVIKLMSIIENEDVEDFLMLQLMRNAKNEETISATEFRKEIKKWK